MLSLNIPLLGFQPTPPHRGRPLEGYDLGVRVQFQPTPPHRGRREFGVYCDTDSVFQPTPPHRGRLKSLIELLVDVCISTHAPAQGAT